MNPQDRISSFQNEYLNGVLAAHGKGEKITGGDAAALRAYLQSNDRSFSRMVVEIPPMEADDFKNMLDSFSKGSITEFVLADASTGLMENLHILLAAGYEVAEPFTHKVAEYHVIKGLIIYKK